MPKKIKESVKKRENGKDDSADWSLRMKNLFLPLGLGPFQITRKLRAKPRIVRNAPTPSNGQCTKKTNDGKEIANNPVMP